MSDQEAAVVEAESAVVLVNEDTRVIAELAKPLAEGLVEYRKGSGGKQFAYIRGYHIIEQANRIFGFGNWGYSVVSPPELIEGQVVDEDTGEIKRSWKAYRAIVEVRVGQTHPRTDVGFTILATEQPESHSTAMKGAVTDALKRALRTYGDQFGNSLSGGDTDSRAVALPSLRRTFLKLCRELHGVKAGPAKEQVLEWTGKELDDLSSDELGDIIERIAVVPS